MSLLEDNAEICSITGAPAFASFKGGFGQAWYGSEHDTDEMVDTTGELDGPICDDEIVRRKEAGTLIVFGSTFSSGEPARASLLPEDAAARIFAREAMRQAERLRSDAKDHWTSATEKKTGLDISPWRHRTAALFSDPLPVIATHEVDFGRAGAIYALATLAAGETLDEKTALEEGRRHHAVAVAKEGRGRWKEV